MLINEKNIQTAVDVICQGGLVALPTETVYGLAADAQNPAALEKIFLAKGRPADHPLIVHLADITQLFDWATDISAQALQLAQTFWPGPLTLILNKASHVSDLITGGQTTIGIRIPAHPVAQAFLRAWGGGVAAPSANRFGRLSPTTAEAVFEELGDRVDYILAGGQCGVGVESTIVDVSGVTPRILRPGMITRQQIEAVLQEPLSQEKNNVPRVAGALESHYAPTTPLKIILTEDLPQVLEKINFPVGLLLRTATIHFSQHIHAVVMSENPAEYAHDLYDTLRKLDKKNFQQLIVEAPPVDEAWDAIRDRLQRASC